MRSSVSHGRSSKCQNFRKMIANAPWIDHSKFDQTHGQCSDSEEEYWAASQSLTVFECNQILRNILAHVHYLLQSIQKTGHWIDRSVPIISPENMMRSIVVRLVWNWVIWKLNSLNATNRNILQCLHDILYICMWHRGKEVQLTDGVKICGQTGDKTQFVLIHAWILIGSQVISVVEVLCYLFFCFLHWRNFVVHRLLHWNLCPVAGC